MSTQKVTQSDRERKKERGRVRERERVRESKIKETDGDEENKWNK